MLPIVETFHSIQGEGYWTGTNAFFIRLAGCNIGCKWCDQKESWHDRYPVHSVESLTNEAKKANPAIVVVTGGEPTMHNLEELTRLLKAEGLRTHIETSGTYPLTGEWGWITLSPKKHKPPIAEYRNAHELKVIIQSVEDLQWAKAIAQSISAYHYFLQPEWGTEVAIALITEFVKENPQWRISLQTHKFLGVR